VHPLAAIGVRVLAANFFSACSDLLGSRQVGAILTDRVRCSSKTGRYGGDAALASQLQQGSDGASAYPLLRLSGQVAPRADSRHIV
jgi:hypothetical protein